MLKYCRIKKGGDIINNNIFITEYELPEVLNQNKVNELFNNIKNNEQSARKKLIKHNIRLVVHIVNKKFHSVEYDKNDLVSIGIIGLIKAVDTFDKTKKIEFANYAAVCINNEILQFLRKIKRDQRQTSLNQVVSFDNDGNTLKLEDLLKSNQDVESEYIESETKNETNIILRNIVNNLSDDERKIITMYFGLSNNKRYTQSEIAREFNVSQVQISRKIKKTLNQIKIILEEQAITELTQKSEKIENKKDCNTVLVKK